MSLLYLANQLGRKMSKLSFRESEYCRAIPVRGHLLWNAISTIPSITIANAAIQEYGVSLPLNPLQTT